ncbi:MAG TPA: Gfo/Idh/MocA family oxidoreductase [Marinilabiliaceae bacterium]|nr:Gfo/Idh/MocA family oxidoreductase [Marinilabiliaceae bacterium]
MKKLKLGVIGMSDGNGHPYSWSAIFNGFNSEYMKDCPFSVIPDYLGKEKYPENFLGHLAQVTHLWTQDLEISNHIAKASNIPNVVDYIEEMIGQVDAVLLARDDAENHFKYAYPFLKEGLPIFIDKPFALKTEDAEELWNFMKYENQIFTCSALQFAEEFQKDKLATKLIGEVRAVWATIPKSWDKYAVHLIEPVLNLLPDRGELITVLPLLIKTDQIKGVQVEWSSGIIAQFQTTGSLPAPLTIRIQGNKGYQDLHFQNSFFAFRESLKRFIEVVNGSKPNIPRAFTREMVEILEGIDNA